MINGGYIKVPNPLIFQGGFSLRPVPSLHGCSLEFPSRRPRASTRPDCEFGMASGQEPAVRNLERRAERGHLADMMQKSAASTRGNLGGLRSIARPRTTTSPRLPRAARAGSARFDHAEEGRNAQCRPSREQAMEPPSSTAHASIRERAPSYCIYVAFLLRIPTSSH